MLVATLAAGCSRGAPERAPSHEATAPAALRPVHIPDFSTLAPAVREQMEAGAAAFRRDTGGQDVPSADLAGAYGEFGMLLMAAGFRTTAASCFLNAESLSPGDLRWPYYLGHIYKRDGKSVESAAAFERAVKADGSYMPALVWLGNAYLDQSRPDEAEPLFTKALALAPDTVAAVFGLGRVALARREYAAAAEHFERALALDPGATAVHHPLALAYRALGRAEEAAAHLAVHDAGGELRPPDPLDVHIPIETAVGYEVRGTRALEAGDWPAAVDSLQKAVQLAPDDPALRHKYGTALALSGASARARDEFGVVTRRRPDFAKAHYSLGLLRLQDGNVSGAVEAFERAVGAAPTYVEAHLQLAHTLRRSGNPAAALPAYARTLEIDPRVGEARFGRAMALAMLNRFAEARDQLVEGQRLHPDETGFALALARVLAAAPDENVRDGKRALAIVDAIPADGRRVEWGVVRGLALAEAGRFAEAVQVQRAVIAALERNGSPELARSQAEVLGWYEKGRPRRTPWRSDEPMELPDSGVAVVP
jgi:tetratricopeptide (TPR) repeat protein